MLIRRGKEEGWLHYDLDRLQKWATASGITFLAAAPAHIPGRGVGLVATRDLEADAGDEPCQILEVNSDLILSMDAVRQHALFDSDFREVLESIGDLGKVGVLVLDHKIISYNYAMSTLQGTSFALMSVHVLRIRKMSLRI